MSSLQCKLQSACKLCRRRRCDAAGDMRDFPRARNTPPPARPAGRALKLSVRDVDPDGSRSRPATHAQRRGRNADSDELLNANEEKLEAVQSPVQSLECARRRPGPSYGDFGATAAASAAAAASYCAAITRWSPLVVASKTRLAVASRPRQKDCQI